MEVPQRFCVRWNSYKSNLQTAFPKLLTSEHFVDVTLACEKQFIKCHKIVLSACSVYFETLLVNNPCQHPIIFMKDVEFWEIKALVEFMYKGEVNVSQNQLDSLLKSAESLQIRGLSGTKQFVNFEQSDKSLSEYKDNKSKSDNDDEDENCKKKKKKNDEDEKFVQITSVRGADDFLKNKLEETDDETHKLVKEERDMEQDNYEYENSYLDPREEEEEEEEGETFSQDIFYPGHGSDPGPSGMSDLCSLALNHVECVMDQEKAKSKNTTNPPENAIKCLVRHQEHNYTNPPKSEGIKIKEEITEGSKIPEAEDSPRGKSSTVRVGSTSHLKLETNQKRDVQPTSTVASEKSNLETKGRVIRKDVFNRIRRSEEELQKAAEMVRGGMTFQTASDTFNIPISTIRFYMARRGILPQRRRGRGSSGIRDDDLIHPPFEIIHYRLPDIDKPL